MSIDRHRLVLSAVGVLLIAGAITGAFLLKNPSAGPRLAQADEGAVIAATARISAALGVGTDGITQANEAYFPGADVSLKWKGGLAEIDGATGLIFLVSQDGQPGDPSARTLDASELDTAADLAVALLGWDEAALKAERFTQERSGMTSEATNQYGKSWLGHTSAGVLNGSRIDVLLDARDKTVLRFLFLPGVGDVQVDTANAIPEDQAVKIAEDKVRSAAIEAARSRSGQEQVDPSEIDIHLKEATLSLTDASGVTGGTTMLIWRIKFEGFDGQGYPAGGTVYMDATNGQVLQQLIN